MMLVLGIDISGMIASLLNSAIILGVAFRGLRAFNRLMSILQDYPPHRHVNGKLIYPKGFEPAYMEPLGKETIVSDVLGTNIAGKIDGRQT